MTKTTIYVIAGLVAVAGAAGGYVYHQRTEVRIEQTTEPQSAPTQDVPQNKPKPDHGDFEKRFQPQPPPANGGRGS